MFKPNNNHGKGRIAGSKNKKTIAKESLLALETIGINPLETSKSLIDNLINNTDLKNSEQLQLLSTMTNLFKYQLLTRAEEIKLDELQIEIQDLQQENKSLKENPYFVGTNQELLEELKKTKEK